MQSILASNIHCKKRYYFITSLFYLPQSFVWHMHCCPVKSKTDHKFVPITFKVIGVLFIGSLVLHRFINKILILMCSPTQKGKVCLSMTWQLGARTHHLWDGTSTGSYSPPFAGLLLSSDGLLLKEWLTYAIFCSIWTSFASSLSLSLLAHTP